MRRRPHLATFAALAFAACAGGGSSMADTAAEVVQTDVVQTDTDDADADSDRIDAADAAEDAGDAEDIDPGDPPTDPRDARADTDADAAGDAEADTADDAETSDAEVDATDADAEVDATDADVDATDADVDSTDADVETADADAEVDATDADVDSTDAAVDAPDAAVDAPDATPTCDDGYELVDGGCRDIDECAAMPCDDNAECIDLEGGYECVCGDGWFGPGERCYDTPCWVYEPVDFEKPDFGDARDCITASVCLTRGDSGPLYNAVLEDGASGGCSSRRPEGTGWAAGPCSEAEAFSGFLRAVDCSPRSSIGETLCLHVLAEDEYHELTVTSFTGGGPGGGVAWTRRLVDGGPCGVGATCSYPEGVLDCACPEGTAGDPLVACAPVE